MANQPDFDLVFLRKATGEKGKVGAGWSNPDGSISVVLNPFVQLEQNPDVVFRLFKRTPYGGSTVQPPKAGVYKNQDALKAASTDEDNVPF